MRYWAFIDNQVKGPFSVDELCRFPEFSPESLVCAEGSKGVELDDWRRASRLPEFGQAWSKAAEERGSQAAAGGGVGTILGGEGAALATAALPPEPTLKDLAALANLEEKYSKLEAMVSRLNAVLELSEEGDSPIISELKPLAESKPAEKLKALAEGIESLKSSLGAKEEELAKKSEASGALESKIAALEEKISSLSARQPSLESPKPQAQADVPLFAPEPPPVAGLQPPAGGGLEPPPVPSLQVPGFSTSGPALEAPPATGLLSAPSSPFGLESAPAQASAPSAGLEAPPLSPFQNAGPGLEAAPQGFSPSQPSAPGGGFQAALQGGEGGPLPFGPAESASPFGTSFSAPPPPAEVAPAPGVEFGASVPSQPALPGKIVDLKRVSLGPTLKPAKPFGARGPASSGKVFDPRKQAAKLKGRSQALPILLLIAGSAAMGWIVYNNPIYRKTVLRAAKPLLRFLPFGRHHSGASGALPSFAPPAPPPLPEMPAGSPAAAGDLAGLSPELLKARAVALVKSWPSPDLRRTLGQILESAAPSRGANLSPWLAEKISGAAYQVNYYAPPATPGGPLVAYAFKVDLEAKNVSPMNKAASALMSPLSGAREKLFPRLRRLHPRFIRRSRSARARAAARSRRRHPRIAPVSRKRKAAASLMPLPGFGPQPSSPKAADGAPSQGGSAAPAKSAAKSAPSSLDDLLKP